MRRARIRREVGDAQGVLGVLTFGDETLWTMELPWRENRRNVSRIPDGKFEVCPRVSPRFGPCLAVHGVEGRSHILFHSGNLAGDVTKGWLSHSKGCILPGMRCGTLTLDGHPPQRAVLGSRTAMRRLMTWADGRGFALEVC